jgi:hypothetical protein
VQKQICVIIVTVCIISIMIAAACGGQVAPAITGKLPAEGESIVILVENTSISLPVREFKSDRDRIMEYIHSALNSILEGKVW